jgi:hypothetical protein
MPSNPSALTIMLAADGVNGAKMRVHSSPWGQEILTAQIIDDAIDYVNGGSKRPNNLMLLFLVRLVILQIQTNQSCDVVRLIRMGRYVSNIRSCLTIK